jgi:hypothetical protein
MHVQSLDACLPPASRCGMSLTLDEQIVHSCTFSPPHPSHEEHTVLMRGPSLVFMLVPAPEHPLGRASAC